MVWIMCALLFDMERCRWLWISSKYGTWEKSHGHPFYGCALPPTMRDARNGETLLFLVTQEIVERNTRWYLSFPMFRGHPTRAVLFFPCTRNSDFTSTHDAFCSAPALLWKNKWGLVFLPSVSRENNGRNNGRMVYGFWSCLKHVYA